MRFGVALAAFAMWAGCAFGQSPTLVGIPQASDPTCNAGEYYLAVLTTGSKWRKCENGVWSDIGSAAGAGEANTASNLGGGLANWDSKSGVDLRFNSFNAAHFDLATNVISVDEPGLESLLDLADLNGLLPLAKITDDASSGLCLTSGGGGGDPAWTTCPGGGGGAPTTADYLVGTANGSLSAEIVVGTSPGGELGGTWASPTIDSDVVEELGQTAGETDLRYDATSEAYYYDVDGDGTHDSDGTERNLDLLKVEVPGDYATVQAALDSNDCKKGTSFGGSNQGCSIRVAPGTYAESFEIGSTSGDTSNYQNSIVIEGVGTAGTENGAGHQQCSVTFTGDDTANNTVIKVNNSIGVILRNFCIDMDESATNDPKYGVHVGYDAGTTKLVTMEHLTFDTATVSGGAGIKIGNDASADAPFIVMRKIRMQDMQTCVIVSSNQAVDLEIDQLECTSPDATIGGLSVTSSGGEILVRNFYFKPGIASQIGINIRNEAIGALLIERPTFEWNQDNGTFINFENPGTNTGAYRSTTIIGGRFQPQTIASTRHVCIDWNRRGTLNIIGNSFESGTSSSRTCEIDLNNPDASSYSDINWIGNDVQWTGVQANMVINESSSGGPLRVNRFEGGSHFIGEDGALVFEGATLDGFETTVSPTDPTADRTVTIPNANSTTVQAQTCTGTDKVSAISGSGVVTCSADSTGGGASLPVVDTTSIAEGSADATKEVRFEVDGLTTATVRVLTMPDFNVDLGNLTDSQISNTLTASNLVGTGSTTNAVDLATAEVNGLLGVSNGGTGAGSYTSTAVLVGAGTSPIAASAVTISSGAVDGVTTLDADGAVTGPSFAADEAATPLVTLDDTIATDTNPEAQINGDAVADDNGRIRLQVEENADGTYYTALDAKSTTGAVTVELGGNGTANFIQIAEGGVLTGEGTATIEAAALTGTVPDASIAGGSEEDEIDLTDLRDSGANTCTGGQSVRRNAGDTAFECFTPSSGSANFVEKSISLSGGSGYFSATVTGATWVTSSSVIQCGVLGTTADGLTPEAIAVSNLNVTVSNRVAGTGFDVVVYSPHGLEGTIRAHCVGA